MSFHRFANQDERRAFGGSDCMEMQYCLLLKGTPISEITAVDGIKHWQDDSLYIYDENEFYQHYGTIFTDGFYANGKRGVLDVCGINYYPPEMVESIIERIKSAKPDGYEILLTWLEQNKHHNGIYILGI